MTDIALVAAEIAPVYPIRADMRNYKLAAAFTKGQAGYVVAASGMMNLADASAAGTAQFEGIALEAGAIGQTISFLRAGEMEGFTISGLNWDVLLYLSNTAGALADAAGTVTVVVGKVAPTALDTPAKLAEIFKRPALAWA